MVFVAILVVFGVDHVGVAIFEVASLEFDLLLADLAVAHADLAFFGVLVEALVLLHLHILNVLCHRLFGHFGGGLFLFGHRLQILNLEVQQLVRHTVAGQTLFGLLAGQQLAAFELCFVVRLDLSFVQSV